MTAMLIDSGVDSVKDLLGLLPSAVAERFDREEMSYPGTAAALRVLATVRDERWQDHVTDIICWADLLEWAREEYRSTDLVRVRVEIAASLAGHPDAQAVLLYAARTLDAESFAAVMDALRIASQGVAL